MKNVFFALALMLVGTFAFANTNVEKQSTNDAEEIINLSKASDNAEFSISYSNMKDEGGYCTITVTDNQTGEIVHQSTIYVNSAEACRAALKAVMASL